MSFRIGVVQITGFVIKIKQNQDNACVLKYVMKVSENIDKLHLYHHLSTAGIISFSCC